MLASVVHADICRDEYDLNDYLIITVSTSRFSTGAAYTAGDTATFDVFEINAGTPNTTEITDAQAMTEDFSSNTGLVLGVIQLTAGNGYTAGRDYVVHVTATVDSVAAGASDTFYIRSASQTNGTTLTEAGGTGDHLTAIDLPNQTMDITGTISTVTEVTAIATDGIPAAALKADALTAIEAEALDALESVQLDHLTGVTTGVAADADLGTYVVDGSILAHIMAEDADSNIFNASTDSLQAIRDQGDSAWITATGFATPTNITAGTITTATNVTTISANGITSTSMAADSINAAAIKDAAIDAATFATAAITADSIATNAIGAAELATDAADEISDDVWDEALTGALHNAATSAGKRLRQITISGVLREEEQAQGGGNSTITLNTNASQVNDFYGNTQIIITGGTGIGQSRHIHSYVGSSRVANVMPDWATNPDATSDYVIMSDSEKHVMQIADGVITAGTIANAAIDNATFAADVGSTTYATNIIALAVRKALDNYDPPTDTEMLAAHTTTDALIDGIDDNPWDAVARTLTANTNFNDLDAAAVATAVWNALTNAYGGAGTYGQAIESGSDATGANQTTILARLAAIMSKDAADPEIGTYDVATDSLEAQQENPQAPPIFN